MNKIHIFSLAKDKILSLLSINGLKYLSSIENYIGNMYPALTFRLRIMIGYGMEEELDILAKLHNNNLVAIDVGANVGMYSYHMKQSFTHVYSFEPNSIYKKRLTSILGDNVSIYSIALSNTNNSAILRVPNGICGMGTIEESNRFGDNAEGLDVNELNVYTKRLDELNIKNVGLIKIDVEGHEYMVLEGGEKTIKDSLPVLIIEAEEKHKKNAIESISKFLSVYGYKTYHYCDKCLYLVDSKSINGNIVKLPYEKYVSNFIFLTDRHFSDNIQLKEIRKNG
jgi:FkbM family methyltransferase